MSPKGCSIGMACRKDILSVVEEDKNDKPIKELVVSKNTVVFSKSAQIKVLPGDIYSRHEAKHRRDINLPYSCEHRKNMIIEHRMNIKVRSIKGHRANLACTP